MRYYGRILVGILCWVVPCSAQWTVYDGVADLNAKFEITQNVVMLVNQALDLLPLNVIVIAETMATDIALLQTLLDEATQVGLDIKSLQQQVTLLFDLNTAPSTTFALAERMRAINTLVCQSRVYAMKVNTLVTTFQNTLRHLSQLLGTIAELAGTKQGLQVLNEKAASLVYVQMVGVTEQAAYQQSELYTRLQEALVNEAMHNIHRAQMADYPTSVPGLR